jgi:hypothetical protein
MSDDLETRGYQDRAGINTNEAWEVAYWAKALGKDQPTAVIKEFGLVVANVKKKLGG